MTTNPHALIRMCARLRMMLTVEGGTLMFHAPRRVVTPEIMQVLQAHKVALIQVLSS